MTEPELFRLFPKYLSTIFSGIIVILQFKSGSEEWISNVIVTSF